MSLDVDGFTNEIEGGEVTIHVDTNHKLLKLARQLPWDEMLATLLPDLQRTEKACWWMGRPLRVRIHLGVYLLQHMFNLTDRVAEQQVRDNAAFRYRAKHFATATSCLLWKKARDLLQHYKRSLT